ncbi:membrane-associated protein, putative [Bodo saltans]|uniref:Membrane-associated protein, putative n=1 Tax=Bodo saltans TaxID=75058 RepID=A0A0S4IJV3_BODSA|nr:membrane-associated protein, putative [Bodo saltans]|eukprot:CUE60994.1 membrane-associated protein, putative [Bodo saltans]
MAAMEPLSPTARGKRIKRVLWEWLACALLLTILIFLDAHGPRWLSMDGHTMSARAPKHSAHHHRHPTERPAVNTLPPGEVVASHDVFVAQGALNTGGITVVPCAPCPLCDDACSTAVQPAARESCPPCAVCNEERLSECPPSATSTCPNKECPVCPPVTSPRNEGAFEALAECQQRLQECRAPPAQDCPVSQSCEDMSRSAMGDLSAALKAMFFGSCVTGVWMLLRSSGGDGTTSSPTTSSKGESSLDVLLQCEAFTRALMEEAFMESIALTEHHDRAWRALLDLRAQKYCERETSGAVHSVVPSDRKRSNTVPALKLSTSPRPPLEEVTAASNRARSGHEGHWARHTPPNSARSVSPLTNSSFEGTPHKLLMTRGGHVPADRTPKRRPASIHSWLTQQQQQTPPPVLDVAAVINGGADASQQGCSKAPSDDAKRRAEVATLSKTMCSMYVALMHDADQHWYARADALFAESRALCKAGLQVKRAQDAKQRDVDDLRRQLEVSSSAWAAKLNDVRSDAERQQALHDARHADHQSDSTRRIAEWEDRFSALTAEKHEQSILMHQLRASIEVLEEAQYRHEKSKNDLEASLRAATVELDQIREREAAKTCKIASTQHDDICVRNVATDTSDILVGSTPLRESNDVSTPPKSPKRSSNTAATTAAIFHEALLRESREKHMAILEAKLHELDQRHQYNPPTPPTSSSSPSSSGFMMSRMDEAHRGGDRSGLNRTVSPTQASFASSNTPTASSATVTSGGEADPLCLVTGASRPTRVRPNQSEMYSQSVLRSFEEASAQRDRNALFDTLAMHHSGVSRRQSSTGSGQRFGNSMDGWLQHPYAAAGDSSKPRSAR